MQQSRYEKISPLKEGGGMGDVWLALDRHTNRHVALKFIKLERLEEDEQALKRFEREIDIALKLDENKHVLPALDRGYMLHEGQQMMFLVSKYMPDGSLHNYMKKTQPHKHWTLEQTMDAIKQAAQGLDYLHTFRSDRIIVHQDVKPGNFLLKAIVPDSKRIVHLLLCDFGIARWLFSEIDITTNPIGTPGYISPEQYMGIITPAADQYALAKMACLLLTGKIPEFDNARTHINEHDRIMAAQRPSLLSQRRELLPEIDNVLLRALLLEPEQRYPSVLAFAKALERAIRQQIKYEESHQFVSGRANPSSVFEVVDIPRIEVNIPERANIRSSSDQASKPVDRSQSKRAHFPRQSLQSSLHMYLELPGRPRTIRWSYDGKAIACTFYDRTPPILYESESGREIARDREPGQACCWSPNGRIVAIAAEGRLEGYHELRFWNREASAAEWRAAIPFGSRVIHDFDWSIYGHLAIWVNNEIELYILPKNLSSVGKISEPQFTIMQGVQPKNSGVLRWSPNGRMLAIGTNTGSLICWNAEKTLALPQWDISTSGRSIDSLVWTKDSTSLVIGFNSKRVVMWNVHEQRIVNEWRNLPLVPHMLSVSVANLVSVASHRSKVIVGDLDAPEPTHVHAGQEFCIWSPTRSQFVTLDTQKEATLAFWNVTEN